MTFRSKDLNPRFSVIFLPMIWIFMESEEPEIKSKQAYKRDRTLRQFFWGLKYSPSACDHKGVIFVDWTVYWILVNLMIWILITDYSIADYLLIIYYWLLLADYWLFIADYYCSTCQNFIRVFFLQKKVTSLWYSKNRSGIAIIYLLIRCLMVSTNQADPGCFYFRIS